MRQLIKPICCAAALLTAATTATAQTVMTVEQCVSDALANNVKIKNAANDVAAAEEERKATFTKYFPTIAATGSGYMAEKHLLSMSMGPGMNLSMLKNGVLGGVSAQMPLFTGGRIRNANQLADTGVKVSRLQQCLSEDEVVLNTETCFWQVVMLKEKLKTVAAVERQLDQFGKDAEAAVGAGVSDRNDLLQVQLKSSTTRSDRIALENSLATARRLLAQYTGHQGDSIDVSVQMDYSMPPSPLPLYAEPEAAVRTTARYALLEQNVKAGKLKYKMTLGECLPSITIGGGYCYDNLMDKGHSYWVGFATVSVPLSGWWGGSHQMKKQRLAVSNAENEMEDSREMLAVDIENKWNDMNNAYRQIGIAIESISQAKENLRLHDDYYKAGTATMSDLLDAQTLYQNSRAAYVEAYARYEICKRQYLQATGR